MVIAWKPRRQARKAVIHAIPWLKAAIRGVSARKDEYIGARLLSEAEAVNADSLIMGAFRFGELYEWVFGGVTYEVLNRTRLPVFMMH